MPSSLTPPITAADLMRILNETLHEVLTGDAATPHGAPADSPESADQPRKTDTAQIHAAVKSSPVPEKLTRREFDLLDD